jgi:cerevisin
MRGALALSAAAAVHAASFSIETVHNQAAPVLSSIEADAIPDSYIVKFKDHVDEDAVTNHHSWIQNIHDEGEQQRLELRKRGLSDVAELFSGMKHTFSIGDAFKGYAGHFHESVIEQLRNHPDVSYLTRAVQAPIRPESES